MSIKCNDLPRHDLHHLEIKFSWNNFDSLGRECLRTSYPQLNQSFPSATLQTLLYIQLPLSILAHPFVLACFSVLDYSRLTFGDMRSELQWIQPPEHTQWQRWRTKFFEEILPWRYDRISNIQLCTFYFFQLWPAVKNRNTFIIIILESWISTCGMIVIS